MWGGVFGKGYYRKNEK